MAEEIRIEGIETEQKTRRSAIKTAAQVAVTVPAVGLLLRASTKSASAQLAYSGDNTTVSDDAGVDDVVIVGDDTTATGDPIVGP